MNVTKLWLIQLLEAILIYTEETAAMTRMYRISLMTKAHGKAAYRLLNKSIIRVEEPDID